MAPAPDHEDDQLLYCKTLASDLTTVSRARPGVLASMNKPLTEWITSTKILIFIQQACCTVLLACLHILLCKHKQEKGNKHD